MAVIDDRDYYRLRLAQEQARAAAANHVGVRRVHLEPAANYEARLSQVPGAEPRLRVVA